MLKGERAEESLALCKTRLSRASTERNVVQHHVEDERKGNMLYSVSVSNGEILLVLAGNQRWPKHTETDKN